MSVPELGVTRQERLEIEELPNGKWQIRRISTITYEDGQKARHYLEDYLQKKEKEKTAIWN